MTKVNLFEVATKEQYRFQHKGSLNVEDLWLLPIQQLDEVFKGLNSQIKQAKEESLLDNKTKEDEVLNNKIEIVKYIVNEKLKEQKEKLHEKENREQRQKIMQILSDKENEDLQNKSADELREILKSLK